MHEVFLVTGWLVYLHLRLEEKGIGHAAESGGQ